MNELYAHSANSQGQRYKLVGHSKEVTRQIKKRPINLGQTILHIRRVCGMKKNLAYQGVCIKPQKYLESLRAVKTALSEDMHEGYC